MRINKQGRKPKHGLINHRLYVKWAHMKQRCLNKDYIGYENYGGAGVKICDEWLNDFKAFYDWAMANGWKEGLQLDKDIKGDGKLYSPETCCFITQKENLNRKRSNVTYNGKKYSLRELSREFNIPYQMLLMRVRNNWSLSDAILIPKYGLYKSRKKIA